MIATKDGLSGTDMKGTGISLFVLFWLAIAHIWRLVVWVAICMSLRSHKPAQSYQRRHVKAPSLAAKASFFLGLNKFERIKVWQITVCQSNTLTERCASFSPCWFNNVCHIYFKENSILYSQDLRCEKETSKYSSLLTLNMSLLL